MKNTLIFKYRNFTFDNLSLRNTAVLIYSAGAQWSRQGCPLFKLLSEFHLKISRVTQFVSVYLRINFRSSRDHYPRHQFIYVFRPSSSIFNPIKLHSNSNEENFIVLPILAEFWFKNQFYCLLYFFLVYYILIEITTNCSVVKICFTFIITKS